VLAFIEDQGRNKGLFCCKSEAFGLRQSSGAFAAELSPFIGWLEVVGNLQPVDLEAID
jgi:hypothetical protein